MRHPYGWRLYLISDGGKVVPHWSATTRAECRRELAALKTQCGGALPAGVRARIVPGDVFPQQTRLEDFVF